MLTQPRGVVSVFTVRVSRRRTSVSTASPPGVNTGRETAGVKPTASAYFRYVSMEATTTRASIVIRSIPTSEILTHASITIPLSSTRSRTSIRLLPPGALSTAILLRFLCFEFQRAYARFDGAHCSPQMPCRLRNTLGSSALRFCFTHDATTDHNVVRLATGCGKTADFEFELGKPLAEFQVFGLCACRQVCIVTPPVQTNLLRL